MKHKVGDVLTEVTHGIIVHGCNAQGVMGSGIARQVKEMYPEAFKAYSAYCDFIGERSSSILGKVVPVKVTDTLIIVNAITQDNFGTHQRQVNYEAVAQCFETIAEQFDPVLPIHYPLIGAGLGGGDWNIISAIINSTLEGRNHTLWTLK